MINNDDKAPIVKTLLVWDDLGYAVRWWGTDHSISFDVLLITGRDAEERTGEAPSYVFVPCQTEGMPSGMFVEKKDATGSGDDAATLDEAAIYVHGFIKWDGCSHLSFPESANCMWHVCGLHSWLSLANLMARIPKVLFPLIPKHDATVAA